VTDENTAGALAPNAILVGGTKKLELDDAALRELTTASSNVSFDERQLMVLLGRTQAILAAILDDPGAFTEKSDWNPKMLTVVTGLLNSARGVIKDHNDIGTNSKHVLGVLEDHTKNFATATARHITDELREVGMAIQVIMDETHDPMTRSMLAKVLERMTVEIPTRLRGVWRDMARKALSEAGEQLKLL